MKAHFLVGTSLLWSATSAPMADAVGAEPTQSPRAAAVAAVESPVKRPIHVISPVAVRDIGGFAGQRLDNCRTAYLAVFDIDRFTRLVEERKHKDWYWPGEQPGKWLESAVLVSGIAGDSVLARKARDILKRLKAAQEPGGYLGITPAEVRTEALPLRGMDAYELYFTLHGLLTAADIWQDPDALETARRLADYLVRHFGPGRAEFWPSKLRPPENRGQVIRGHSELAGHSVHYGWEGSLLIDPIMRIHQATGDRRYLEWTQWVVSRLDTWSGHDAFSKLDQVADGTIGIHQIQPVVHAHTFHMNFLGLLRLYEATGDATLLRKVRGAWEDISRRQVYITGGVSVAERYQPGHTRPLTGEAVETCANLSWLQLNQALFEFDGDSRHADLIERLLWNHIFAAQTIDGDSIRYHTPPNGFKPDDYFRGPHCCTSSGHRMLAMLPGTFYAQSADALYINQFVPSTANFTVAGNTLRLRQETRYPETDLTTVHVEPSSPTEFTLRVRLPAWCAQPALTVNGQRVQGMVPGTYAEVRRRWQKGDIITLTLPMTPQWVEHDHFPTQPAPLALVRGPVVYALDTVWWDTGRAPMPREIAREATVSATAVPRLVSTGARSLGPFYEADVTLGDGRCVPASFVPFANIGRWYRDGETKPPPTSQAYSYAVWLPRTVAGSSLR